LSPTIDGLRVFAQFLRLAFYCEEPAAAPRNQGPEPIHVEQQNIADGLKRELLGLNLQVPEALRRSSKSYYDVETRIRTVKYRIYFCFIIVRLRKVLHRYLDVLRKEGNTRIITLAVVQPLLGYKKSEVLATTTTTYLSPLKKKAEKREQREQRLLHFNFLKLKQKLHLKI